MSTTNFEHLTKQIERVVQEHMASSQRAAEDAVAHAFAAAVGRARRVQPLSQPGAGGRRRTAAEIAARAEQLYHAVCAKPGETMAVLAASVGAPARELERPMACLRRNGRVRSAGLRHLTRYFPMADKSAKST